MFLFSASHVCAAEIKAYAVQGASFVKEKNANAIANKLRNEDDIPYVARLKDLKNQDWNMLFSGLHEGRLNVGKPEWSMGKTINSDLETKFYTLEVASFYKEENARKMASSLKNEGYDSGVYWLKNNDGQVWFVNHLGGYNTPSEAVIIAEKYRKGNKGAAVFFRSLDKTFFEERSLPLEKKAYVVQIGSFKKQKNAANLNTKLGEKGFPLILYKSSSNGKSWIVLALGVFESRDEAKDAAERYQHEIKNDPVSIRVFSQNELAKKIININITDHEENYSEEFDKPKSVAGENINIEKMPPMYDSTPDVRKEMTEKKVPETDEEIDNEENYSEGFDKPKSVAGENITIEKMPPMYDSTPDVRKKMAKKEVPETDEEIDNEENYSEEFDKPKSVARENINIQKTPPVYDSTPDVKKEMTEKKVQKTDEETNVWIEGTKKKEALEGNEALDIQSNGSKADARKRESKHDTPESIPSHNQEKDAPPSPNEKALPHIKIEDVLFTGNTVITTETLRKLIEDFQGLEFTNEVMKEITEKVTQFYTDNGYALARAYLPPQYFHPKRSFLIIAIIEGKIGEVKIEGNTYYHDDVIKRNLKSQINHMVINDDKIEEGLHGIKDMPNINAAKTEAFFKKSKERGSVDLIIKTQNNTPWKMGMDYNNLGSELTSKNRFGGHFEISDPIFDSMLNLKFISGGILDFSDFSLLSGEWTVPVNGYGTSVSLSRLMNEYALGKELTDLGIKGNATIHGLKVTHPLKRKRSSNVRLSAGYENKHAKNYLLNDLNGIDHLDLYSMTMDFDFDDWFHGKNVGSFGWHYGKIRIGDRNFLRRPDADETFSRFSFDYARIQNLHTPLKFAKYAPVIDIAHLILHASCQLSMDRLLPMEEMVIGGYGSARGHAPSLFLGDSGYTFSAELNFTPSFLSKKTFFGQSGAQSYKLALFLDHGVVFKNDPAPGETPSENLTGYGAGFRLLYKDKFQFQFDMAFPANKKTIDEDDVYYYFIMSYDFF